MSTLFHLCICLSIYNYASAVRWMSSLPCYPTSASSPDPMSLHPLKRMTSLSLAYLYFPSTSSLSSAPEHVIQFLKNLLTTHILPDISSLLCSSSKLLQGLYLLHFPKSLLPSFVEILQFRCYSHGIETRPQIIESNGQLSILSLLLTGPISNI